MPPAPPWERQAPADPPTVVPTLRRELTEYARFLGAGRETCDAIALAVSEALTNVVQHAYVGQEPGPVNVQARLEPPDHLLVRVTDEGRGPVPRPDSPGLGLGLRVMAQIADHFSIANRESTRGTIVTLRFSLRTRELTAADGTAPAAGEPPINDQ